MTSLRRCFEIAGLQPQPWTELFSATSNKDENHQMIDNNKFKTNATFFRKRANKLGFDFQLTTLLNRPTT